MAFAGKVVIVTGAAGGLGLSIAREFLAQKANVVVTDVLQPRLDEAKNLIPAETQDRFLTFNVDSSDSAAVEGLFSSVVEKFGNVDVLVNNAGISDVFDPVGDVPRELWDKVLRVNLTGPMTTSQHAVRQMTKQEAGAGGIRGVILNVASAAGSRGFCAGVAYTSSKHGVIGLTKNTAAFYGFKGIRCLAILPGGMGQTNIVDAFKDANVNKEGMELSMKIMQTGHGWSDIADVGKVVASLCSDSFVVVNGACIPVDNGWSA